MSAFRIRYSRLFVKHWRNLPASIKEKAIFAENIFKHNIHDPRLKTHPLKGNLENNFSFSVNYHYRIIFYQNEKSEIIFVDIGTHQIYK